MNYFRQGCFSKGNSRGLSPNADQQTPGWLIKGHIPRGGEPVGRLGIKS